MTSTDVTEAKQGGGVSRLLSGQSNIDFVGRSRQWLILSLVLVAVSLAALLIRQLDFSLDFTGGTRYQVVDASGDFTVDELRDAVTEAGVTDARVQVRNNGEGAIITTPATEEIGGEEAGIVAAIAEVTGVDPAAVSVSAVSASWGVRVSRQALYGLLVFLVLVVIYITLRFEWRVAAAALVTLVHDVIVTVGLYALVGFEVSPASIVAFLTILGYSLYDTVVVFDRVKEDTASLTSVSTVTYGDMANRALNEVLVRSLSTSLTSLLPVGSLLFIGATLLGADTLQDLALALFVGMAVGTFSSITVATPFLVWLKEKEPRFADLKARVHSRRGAAATEPATATTPASATPSAPRGASKSRKPPRRR